MMENKTKSTATPWKVLSAILAVALIAVSCAWAFTANGSKGQPTDKAGTEAPTTADQGKALSADKIQQKRKIIIDTDTAGDDAAALIIAAKDPNVEILGVTVSEGNVKLDQAVKNALMTLEMAGSDAPVYAGADATYTGNPRDVFSVFGKDGMGDQDLIHPTRKAADGSAIDFILDTIKANPDEVEIIALGPVTNLALAFDKDEETMKRVKRYWSMGTTGFGHGNATPVAEFNVYHDAEAYKVFAESGVPVTVLGLDMMNDDVIHTKEWLDEIASKGGLSEFFAKSFGGLVKFNEQANGKAYADNPDGTCMACVLWDGFVQETEACHPVVMTEDNETYGQVVLYKKSRGYDSGITFEDYNFNVITKINSKGFREKLASLLEQ